MTNGTQRSDFEKYQYGALAARLTSSEESSRYIPGALEVLADSKGLNLGEEALGFIRGTQASEEGIRTAIQIYGQKFEEKRGAYTPIELATSWYDSVLSEIDKDDRTKIVTKLARYNETLSEIKKKAQTAVYIVKAPKESGLFTTQQESEAKETSKKYQDVLEVIEALDRYTFEDLRFEAVKSTRKTELKELASKF